MTADRPTALDVAVDEFVRPGLETIPGLARLVAAPRVQAALDAIDPRLAGLSPEAIRAALDFAVEVDLQWRTEATHDEVYYVVEAWERAVSPAVLDELLALGGGGMSAARAKGTRWETAIVEHLRANDRPWAERRALHGSNDKGDVTGLPGVVIEAKAAKSPQWGPWLAELADETTNAGADIGVLWVKRVGKAQAADGLIVMTPATFLLMLKEGGW